VNKIQTLLLLGKYQKEQIQAALGRNLDFAENAEKHHFGWFGQNDREFVVGK